MHGYMTKYALTVGIQEVEVEEGSSGGGYVYTKERWRVQLQKGKTFFNTKEEAVEAAKKMARRRVASLEKSIKKARELAENVKWGPCTVMPLPALAQNMEK